MIDSPTLASLKLTLDEGKSERTKRKLHKLNVSPHLLRLSGIFSTLEPLQMESNFLLKFQFMRFGQFLPAGTRSFGLTHAQC